MNIIIRIIGFIFPIIKFWSANKKIEKRISEINNNKIIGNLKYIDDVQKYNFKEIEPFYNNSIEIKKTLEDKAKICSIALTLCASLIIGLTGFTLKENFIFGEFTFYKVLLIILLIYLIININIASILSILVLGNKNMIYQLYPQEAKLNNDKKGQILAICTEQNTNMNIIRQNYVYSSFLHLIYSLIILSVLFFISPLLTKEKRNSEIEFLKLTKDIATIIKNDSIVKENFQMQINTINDSLEKYLQYKKNFDSTSIDIKKSQKK